MLNVMRKMAYELLGYENSIVNRVAYPIQKKGNCITVFNTSMNTDNLGDYIIMQYCRQFLDTCFHDYEQLNISTHRVPTKEEEDAMRKTKYKFICGTNLLTSYIEQWWNWRLPEGYRGKSKYRNMILLGVGWNQYQDECSAYSKLIYRTMLNPYVLHSVRDQYTLDKLRSAGFSNIINTGCPTTWQLTPELCRDIPTQKANNVVTTITDYRRDPERDNQMIDILSQNYEHIYLWLQGRCDEEYLATLNVPNNLTTISSSIEAYEDVLKKGGVDYVGTRLHAGIHALNHKIRSLIVAVDNRAIEMAKDIDLPIIMRDDIDKNMERWILSVQPTQIHINLENINKFKQQFQ